MIGFKNKKRANDPGMNQVKENLARQISGKILACQRAWAEWMNKGFATLPMRSKKLALVVFVLGFVAVGVRGLAVLFNQEKVRSHSLTKVDRTGQVTMMVEEQPPKISDKEFLKLQRIKVYLDSLSRSRDGQQLWDSLRQQHPGLMDSIAAVEELYRIQHKK